MSENKLIKSKINKKMGLKCECEWYLSVNDVQGQKWWGWVIQIGIDGNSLTNPTVSPAHEENSSFFHLLLQQQIREFNSQYFSSFALWLTSIGALLMSFSWSEPTSSPAGGDSECSLCKAVSGEMWIPNNTNKHHRTTSQEGFPAHRALTFFFL